MIDLSALTPFVVTFLVFGIVAAGLALAALAQLLVEATSTPRSRPVVLITTDRVPARSAA